MHGSSSVPQDWLKIINSYGGDIGQTYGVPVDEIVTGIKYGVRKSILILTYAWRQREQFDNF
jgi:fructose-bisphosphate aldolase class II